MICFLTSAPILNDDFSYSDTNGFITLMKQSLTSGCKALFICSDPDAHERSDNFAFGVLASFVRSGFRFSGYDVLDGRNRHLAKELVSKADFICLMGGHVPTQNRFFTEIGLKELLAVFDGVLMGVSAGSMNSAETVYAQPEWDGEALDPHYKRFLKGLGLTETMLLPHYQDIKNDVLDGLRVFEDIAYPDSIGRKFYAVPDGTFIYINGGEQQLRGEAYLISEGMIKQISSVGDVVPL